MSIKLIEAKIKIAVKLYEKEKCDWGLGLSHYLFGQVKRHQSAKLVTIEKYFTLAIFHFY